MATQPKPPLTEEEYLRLEHRALNKSEFHAGQVFAMAGGSPKHSLLANTIGAILQFRVSSECNVYNADLRIYIPAAQTYTYADCSVLCGELQTPPDRDDCVLNPKLIVEVLSPSTEAYDRGQKFELYRAIPSFTDYLLVHQERPLVEHYARQPDSAWELREQAGMEVRLPIANLNLEIPLAELYANRRS